MSARRLNRHSTTSASPRVTVDARMLGSGGIGTYIEELLPRVIERLASVRFTVLGDDERLRELLPRSERISIRRFECPIYTIREQLLLPTRIPSDTSLFWSPHYNIPLLWRGALAVTVHDVAHLTSLPSTLPRRLYARSMFAAVRRRADVVFCVSEWTAAEVERLVGSPRRRVVLRNGVAQRWLEGGTHDAAASPPYFLFVGSVKPHKNLVRLIEAMAKLVNEIPHRLLIAGRVDGMRTVDRGVLARARELGDRVEYVGFATPDALERLVRRCDALVLPSVHEGFGLPPLEALAAGRPVAVSELPVLREVCGPMAAYFDPVDVSSIADALKLIAGRSPDTAAIVEARRAWARQFDWDATTAATSEQLLRVLAD